MRELPFILGLLASVSGNLWDVPRPYYKVSGDATTCSNVPDKVEGNSTRPGWAICKSGMALGKPKGKSNTPMIVIVFADTPFCVCNKKTEEQLLSIRIMMVSRFSNILIDPKKPLVINDIPLDELNTDTGFSLECGYCIENGVFVVL